MEWFITEGKFMKAVYSIITGMFVLTLCGMASNVDAQESSTKMPITNPPFPVADEAIDLATYPVKPDPKLGIATAQLGVGKIYQLEVTLVEIPPGGQVPPVRHLAEGYIYIVAGEGYTTMWRTPGEKPQRYNWKAGDLLSPSLNVWHQQFNTNSNTPARYVSLTTIPLSKNMFYNEESITSSDLMFDERWQQGVTQKPEYKAADSMDMKAGHLVPDLPGIKLQEVGGRWGMNLRPDEGDLAGNRLMEAFVRDYHSNDTGVPSHGDRHPWEKVYLGLEGEGSAILKPIDGPAKVVNWKKGELFFVEGYEHHDIGPRFGAVPKPPYPRIMQMKAPGYFDDIGVVGETEYTKISKEGELTIEIRE